MKDTTPFEYDKSPLAEIAAFASVVTSASVLSVKDTTPELYDKSPLTEIAPCASVFEKYLLVEPSVTSSVVPDSSDNWSLPATAVFTYDSVAYELVVR